MFTNISEILSTAIKLRLIFVANSVAAGKHRQAKFRRFLGTTPVLYRGSQWGGGFYGYRLKFWLFYGYRLIFFSYG